MQLFVFFICVCFTNVCNILVERGNPHHMTVGMEVFSDSLPELVKEYSVGLDPCYEVYGLHCIKQSKSSLSSPLRFSESGTQQTKKNDIGRKNALGYGLFLLLLLPAL